MVQNRLDLAGPVGHVDQTGDSANQLGRIIGEQEFGDVEELERDDVAPTQSQPEQRVGESERGASPRRRSTACRARDRNLVGRPLRLDFEPVGHPIVVPIALGNEPANKFGVVAHRLAEIDHRSLPRCVAGRTSRALNLATSGV